MNVDIEDEIISVLEYQLVKSLQEPCPASEPNWLNGYKVTCVEGVAQKTSEGKTKTGRKKVIYENIPCLQCGGKGVVLTDSGKQLLEFIKRWL